MTMRRAMDNFAGKMILAGQLLNAVNAEAISHHHRPDQEPQLRHSWKQLAAEQRRNIKKKHAHAPKFIDGAPAHEKQKLPHGAFGWTEDGQPFGLNFNHQYVRKGQEKNYPRLSPPFEGRTKQGAVVYDIRLPEKVNTAWAKLGEKFKQVAEHNSVLRGTGWYATEGFRSVEDQERIKASKDGAWATKPRYSEHHVGAVDVFHGNRKDIYYFRYDPERVLRNPNYLPPAVQCGFIPTMLGEAWHDFWVGEKAAAAYWRVYGQDIVRSQTGLELRDGKIVKKEGGISLLREI